MGLGEGDFVIVDGKLIPTDRIRADEPYYSQKHKKHGVNVQVIARSDGTPLRFSRAAPGRTLSGAGGQAMHVCARRANAPSLSSSPGDCYDKHAVQRTASAKPSQPSTPSSPAKEAQ